MLVKEDEEKDVLRIVYENGVKNTSELFPWICVPLVIEADGSEPGGTWAEMKELGALGSEP